MSQGQTHDFVIVGSGAGGGPLAANLALAGHTVLLIEAGGDSINDNYSVPAFHGLSTEDPLFSWEFYVKHYSDTNRPERDPKYHQRVTHLPGSPGIFYPRATGLGGCTTHHAMITVYPHNSDWDVIADLVGDDSWRAEHMRKYFDRLERAQYREGSVLFQLLQPEQIVGDALRRLTASDSREEARGQKGAGWLAVTQADPLLLRRDTQLLKMVKAAYQTAKRHHLPLMPGFDPNHPSVAKNNAVGVNVIPISVDNGRRTGARERVLEAQQILQDLTEQGEKAGQLDVMTNTFATNVVFADDDPTRAIGVRCVPGEALYAARHHTRTAGQPGAPIIYRASKEVILCGGAFNTPQLLMLSGIGPEHVLRRADINIPVRVPLPGVGANLQDRYEVGVVARLQRPFKLLKNTVFRGRDNPTDLDPDPIYAEWREHRKGIYATNGSVLGIIMRSSTRAPSDPPDLYIFGVPGYFRGYEIGYAEKAVRSQPQDSFTWAVLKGHTDNVSGHVTLKSPDPFATPEIHFKYFEESNQSDAKDVQSVVDGVKFAQEIYARLAGDDAIAECIAPTPGEDLEQFVRDNAWGHHASCTCKIGKDGDPEAVLDKDFQVRGAKNLRVVDASVFPRIPGLFIVSAVYMISEKASDVIIDKYR